MQCATSRLKITPNPPYIQLQANQGAVGKLYEHCGYKSFFKMGDIYCLFMELGYNILASKGILSYINPNTWLQSVSFAPIRRFLTTNMAWLQTLITPKVFESATVDTHCLLFSKTDKYCDCRIYRMDKNRRVAFLHTIPMSQVACKEQPINIEADPKVSALVTKMLSSSTRIGKVMTVYNGVKPFAKGRGIPPQTAEMVKEHPYVKEGAKPDDTWLPLMRGSLMHRYVNFWNNDYWILYGPNLAEPRDPQIFSAPEKIIVRQTGDSIIAMIIGKDIICRNNLHVCIPQNPNTNLFYVLGILNSKATDFVYSFQNPEKGEALAEVKKIHVENLPLPYADDKTQNEIVQLVKQVIDSKKNGNDSSNIEREIDLLVYSLYKLSSDEISLIESR